MTSPATNDTTAKVYAFDVFDTCVVRTFARPADLFYALARRVLTACRGEENFGQEEVSELAQARVAAEKRAHRETSKGDINLEDIYDAFTELEAWRISPDWMRAEEVRLEKASLRPIARTKRRIAQLKGEGQRVVFISDMYLSKEVIQEVLIGHGIATADDPLYVSSELEMTKRTGELFKHVLEREGVQPGDLHHCGDSMVGDFLAARKLGIKAELFDVSHLNRFERAILDDSHAPPWVYAQLAGLCRAARLMCKDEGDTAVTDIAANVVAPLLTSFVLWTLQDAKQRGTERLHFVARDGQIMHKIAQELAQTLNAPELHYLYGSRQAWYLPSVASLEGDDLAFLVLTGQSSAPRHNLKRLDLKPEDLEGPLRRHGFAPETWDEQLDEESEKRFWAFIYDDEVAPVVMRQAREAREVALAYFEQEGLLRDDKWALVDIGWTLRTQASFKKILGRAGQPHTLGYYLGISKTRFSATEYGQARGFWLEEFEQGVASSGIRYLFQNKGLIDQIFTMADHGSTRGYARRGNKIEPVLSELKPYPQREAFLEQVHRTVTTFAAELAKTPLIHEGADDLKRCAHLVTGMLIGNPTRREAKALAWAPISDDPNELRAVKLAKPLSVSDLYKIAKDVALRVKDSRTANTKTVPSLFYKDLAWGFSWLEGSVALSGLPAKFTLWTYEQAQRLNREKKVLALRVLTVPQNVSRKLSKLKRWRF